MKKRVYRSHKEGYSYRVVFFILGDSLMSEFYVEKTEQTECSETSAHIIQLPWCHPNERIQHSQHGESLKQRAVM